MNGIKCESCQETFYYDDELVFLLGDKIVYVDEQYPDWTKVYCVSCAEEMKLI